jgi:Flp pilus assembly protein TadD
MDENTQRLFQEANQARLSGDYDQALPLLQQALEACPESPQCLWAMGHVLLNTGLFEEAIASLEKAVELDAGNALYVLDLAKSLEMLGEFERAKPMLEKVVEMEPGSRHADEARKSLRYY